MDEIGASPYMPIMAIMNRQVVVSPLEKCRDAPAVRLYLCDGCNISTCTKLWVDYDRNRRLFSVHIWIVVVVHAARWSLGDDGEFCLQSVAEG